MNFPPSVSRSSQLTLKMLIIIYTTLKLLRVFRFLNNYIFVSFWCLHFIQGLQPKCSCVQFGNYSRKIIHSLQMQIFFNSCITYQYCFILAWSLHEIWILLKAYRCWILLKAYRCLLLRKGSLRTLQAELAICYTICHFAKSNKGRPFLGSHMIMSGPELFGHQAARKCQTGDLSPIEGSRTK